MSDGTVFSPGECGVLASALAGARMMRELTGVLYMYGFCGEFEALSAQQQQVEDALLAKCERGVRG